MILHGLKLIWGARITFGGGASASPSPALATSLAFSTHYLSAACRDMRLPVATDLGIWQLKPFSFCKPGNHTYTHKNDSLYSITERRVPELMPILCSQPAGDVSHKPGGRLPLLSPRPAVTPAIIKRVATNFAA